MLEVYEVNDYIDIDEVDEDEYLIAVRLTKAAK